MFGAGEHFQRLSPNGNLGAPTHDKVRKRMGPFSVSGPGGHGYDMRQLLCTNREA